MKMYDVTRTISNQVAVWPGDPQVFLERIHKIEEGSNSNVSRLELSVHTGTHVDAPRHFIQGAKTVETLPLDILVGPAQVVQLADSIDLITADVVAKAGIQPGVQRLIFKTRNTSFWTDGNPPFHTDFVAVNEDAAEVLVAMGIRLVGIDYLSIAPFKKSRPTHEVLLKAEMVIVEGLDLREVQPGMYTLICLPAKLGGSDGALARVVLVEGKL